MSNKSLKALHTALIDAREGYEKAVQDAENPQVASIFKHVSALHEQSHAGIHQILLERGEQFDEFGSVMAAVHKTVIAVRSAVTGSDQPSLASFASGEERIVEDYGAAIAENGWKCCRGRYA